MKRLVTALLLFAPTTRAYAAEPRPISLQEAVTLAERNAPAVIQAEGQTRTSVAGVRSAYAAFVPSVSVSAGATRQLPAGARTRVENGQIITLTQDPWSTSLGLGASVDLFDGGRRFFDLRQARARESGARVGEVLQRYGAALAAKQEFFNVLAARESQAAAQSQLDQAEQQSRSSMARVAARNATRSDSLRAEIQVRNARLAVMQAAIDLDVSNASLTRIVGSDVPVTAAPESLVAPVLALDEAALRTLAEDGPAVRQAKAAYDAARAARSGAWTDYLPSIGASYSRSGSGTSSKLAFNPGDLDYSGALRLSASLPLFNQWQREAQVTQAQVTLRNAEATLRDMRLAAHESLVQSLGAFRSAAERVASQVATVAAAEEDLRVQQQRYAVGGSTQLDVLTSQTQLDQARRDLIRARYDQRVAKAQLESLVGRDL
jgi:outer membrane protein